MYFNSLIYIYRVDMILFRTFVLHKYITYLDIKIDIVKLKQLC